MTGSVDDFPALLARIGHGRWVGRLSEMAEANTLWQQAASGQGQVLLISGEPGIGKTRFVRELAATARAAGACVMSGECYAEGSAPYAPVAQMIGDLLEESALGNIDLPAENLGDFTALAPSLQTHIPNQIQKQNLDPHFAHQKIFESFIAFCTALTAKSPLVLFLDDVHWADLDTLFLVRNLARRGRRLPILNLRPGKPTAKMGERRDL
jgi:predicted ATPase